MDVNNNNNVYRWLCNGVLRMELDYNYINEIKIKAEELVIFLNEEIKNLEKLDSVPDAMQFIRFIELLERKTKVEQMERELTCMWADYMNRFESNNFKLKEYSEHPIFLRDCDKEQMNFIEALNKLRTRVETEISQAEREHSTEH